MVVIPRMNNKCLAAFLIIVSVGINVYFRLNSLLLPNIDSYAKEAVYNGIRADLNKDINLLYPDLPEPDKKALSDTTFNLYLKENSRQVRDSVVTKSKETKEYFQDKNGWTYLLEIDPYRWHRRIKNYLDTGHFGTNYIKNQGYDNLMSAPFGEAKIEPLKLHYYIGAVFFRALHSIDNKLSLTNALSLVPVFFSAIMVSAIFMAARLLGLSYPAGFAASLVVGLSNTVLARTSFGFFDTDIYNMFLPLLIASFVACSFRQRASKGALFLLLAGALVGVYSAIWAIWWLIAYILFLGLCAYWFSVIVYNRNNSQEKNLQKCVSSIALFILFSTLSVLIISGKEAIGKAFWEPFWYLSLRSKPAIDNFWPAMAGFISELQRADTEYIFKSSGGGIILYGALFGMLSMILKRAFLDFKEKGFLANILFIWFLIMLVLTYASKRFFIFLIVPIGISFAAFLDFLFAFLYKRKNKIALFRRLNDNAYSLLLSGVFAIGLILPVRNAYGSAPAPFFNDSWQNMMVKIKETTPKGSIITSYWEPGDWIMSIAERRTLHCAAWQHTPVPYWVARALLSKNENEAGGILRMLNSGGNLAFDEINKLFNNDKLSSLELVNKMIMLSNDDGGALLSKYTRDNAAIDKILKLMYGAPAPLYLIVYSEMANTIETLSMIADWDFQRYDLWRNFTKLDKRGFIDYAQKKFSYSKEEAARVYRVLKITDKSNILSWISAARHKFYTPYSKINITQPVQKTILFDNGLIVDKERLTAHFYDSSSRKWLAAGKVIFVSRGALKEGINKDGDKNYAAFILEDNDVYRAVIATPELAESVFFKLYFAKGIGLNHFKLISNETKEGYSNIYLYKFE